MIQQVANLAYTMISITFKMKYIITPMERTDILPNAENLYIITDNKVV